MKQRLSLSQRPIQEREPAAMSGLEALIAAPIKKLYQPTEPGSSEPIAAPAKINMASIAAEVAMKEERRRKKSVAKKCNTHPRDDFDPDRSRPRYHHLQVTHENPKR